MTHTWSLVLLAVAAFGCGPINSTRHRYTFTPYAASEYRQSKDGLIVELEDINRIPENFFATVQACNGMVPLVDQYGAPVTERICLVPPGHIIEKASITNNTGHVVRLNQATVRLFDPAGQQYEWLGYEEVQAALLSARPCSTTSAGLNQLRLVKLFNRNIEIVPDTTFTGYLMFHPANGGAMPGTWKFSFYELPVKTNDAGQPVKTTRFEIRTVLKHYVDYYRQDSVLAPPVLVRSEELSN